jgi:hypothetical protein
LLRNLMLCAVYLCPLHHLYISHCWHHSFYISLLSKCLITPYFSTLLFTSNTKFQIPLQSVLNNYDCTWHSRRSVLRSHIDFTSHQNFLITKWLKANFCFIIIYYGFYFFSPFALRFLLRKQMTSGIYCFSSPNSGFPCYMDPFPKEEL